MLLALWRIQWWPMIVGVQKQFVNMEVTWPAVTITTQVNKHFILKIFDYLKEKIVNVKMIWLYWKFSLQWMKKYVTLRIVQCKECTSDRTLWLYACKQESDYRLLLTSFTQITEEWIWWRVWRLANASSESDWLKNFCAWHKLYVRNFLNCIE